jgi:hypothetical protein
MQFVIAGLDPAIHLPFQTTPLQGMDAQIKSAHDDGASSKARNR